MGMAETTGGRTALKSKGIDGKSAKRGIQDGK
jgi:hypothetical protein